MELIVTRTQLIEVRSKSKWVLRGVSCRTWRLWSTGVDIAGKKLKFLRRIPIDPMTGGTEWGLRAMQDDPDSDSWNWHGSRWNQVQGLVTILRRKV